MGSFSTCSHPSQQNGYVYPAFLLFLLGLLGILSACGTTALAAAAVRLDRGQEFSKQARIGF